MAAPATAVAPASSHRPSAHARATSAATATVPVQSAPTSVVPSAGLPADISVDRSNANLAVARFQGRYFLVFRTAKWQIADDNTRLYIVSSADQVHWRSEGTFTYGRDLRERGSWCGTSTSSCTSRSSGRTRPRSSRAASS